MKTTMTNKAGDIFRQEIGALADADGIVRAVMFFNTCKDGSLMASVSVHGLDKSGRPEQAPTYHSGWFLQADTRLARSAVEYLQIPADLSKVLFRRQYSVLTTIHYGAAAACGSGFSYPLSA